MKMPRTCFDNGIDVNNIIISVMKAPLNISFVYMLTHQILYEL